jgi:hypothetical protein
LEAWSSAADEAPPLVSLEGRQELEKKGKFNPGKPSTISTPLPNLIGTYRSRKLKIR